VSFWELCGWCLCKGGPCSGQPSVWWIHSSIPSQTPMWPTLGQLLQYHLQYGGGCHDFHPFYSFLSKFKVPKHFVQIMTWRYLFLSYLILSYLILSYLFTLQSHTKKTRKADSIGIPIQNYLLVDWDCNPLILLIGAPIPILLHIRLVSTMRPRLIKGQPIEELVDGSVRTDLANRPTEPMLVSFRARYTKLWGNCGFLQSGSRQTTPVCVGVTCGSGISVVRVGRE